MARGAMPPLGGSVRVDYHLSGRQSAPSLLMPGSVAVERGAGRIDARSPAGMKDFGFGAGKIALWEWVKAI